MPPDPTPSAAEAPAPLWRRLRRPGAAISAAAHALLFAAAVLMPQPAAERMAPPESITVDLITEPPPSPPEERLAALPAVPLPPPVKPPEPEPEMPKLVHARRILSGGALDSEARAALGGLQVEARFEQLCDVEAMEQIAKSDPRYKPERTIAYLTAGTEIDGDTLTASGAAFLSEGHWYRLAFKCRVTPDRQRIVSFDFATGEQVADDDPRLPSGASD